MALGNHGFDASKNVYDLKSLVDRITALENSTKCPFPIGAIYTTVGTDNPNNTWESTTWVRFGAGQTLVGYNASDSWFNRVLNNGGSKDTGSISVSVKGSLPANTGSTTLTVNQIPSHRHGAVIGNNGFAMFETQTDTQGTGVGFMSGTGRQYYAQYASATGTTGGGQGHTHTIGGTVTSTGTISALSKMQPYIVVYFWRRTA